VKRISIAAMAATMLIPVVASAQQVPNAQANVPLSARDRYAAQRWYSSQARHRTEEAGGPISSLAIPCPREAA